MPDVTNYCRSCVELLARAEAAEKRLGEAVDLLRGVYGTYTASEWFNYRDKFLATLPPSEGERKP